MVWVVDCTLLLHCESWALSTSCFDKSSKGISVGGVNPDWYLKQKDYFHIIYNYNNNNIR